MRRTKDIPSVLASVIRSLNLLRQRCPSRHLDGLAAAPFFGATLLLPSLLPSFLAFDATFLLPSLLPSFLASVISSLSLLRQLRPRRHLRLLQRFLLLSRLLGYCCRRLPLGVWV